jgi:hypothetical protein
MRLLLAQLLPGSFYPHLLNIALQLINSLFLPLLHEAPNKEKQEENHKPHNHIIPSFLFIERINVYSTAR